ncbi:MAG: hypothetical protein DRG30_09700 [Epsilonproteobacteria bacterium]|nr:MAG: hypothetical protein DRG30_09700 [Campylobacterota bacterium]
MNNCYEISKNESAGTCYSLIVNQGGACYSVTSTDDEDGGGGEGPLPEKLAIKNIYEVKDIILNGLRHIAFLGLYEYDKEGEKSENGEPVVARAVYTPRYDEFGGIQGSIIIVTYEYLSDFDPPIPYENISLESFDIGDGTSNIAIRTETEMIYLESFSFSELSRQEGYALKYPFAHTDDTYWTELTHDTGDTSTPPRPAISEHLEYQSNYYSHAPVTMTWDEYEEYIALITSKKYAIEVNDFSRRVEVGDAPGTGSNKYTRRSTWINSYAGELPSGLNIGQKTVSRDIVSNDDVYLDGMNHYVSNPRVSLPAPYTESVNPYRSYEYNWSMGVGARYSAGNMPTEIDLSKIFLAVRPDFVIGEGYISLGGVSSSANTEVLYWETQSGKFWDPSQGGYFPPDNQEYWKNYNRSFFYAEGHTAGARFVLAPFDSQIKLQVGSDWIAMGTVAISVISDYRYIVTDLPVNAEGIAGAILDGYCIIPIESPEDGFVLDQSFKMEDTQVETSDVDMNL